MVTAEEAPFTDGKGDVKKTVLSGSEIDGGESLSFWHSPSDRFRVALAAAVIVICVWLLWHTLHERQGVNEGRRKGNKI